ncbi:MAG: phosphatidylglycerophosphatase A [Desulfurivibrionaceae bacterium]
MGPNTLWGWLATGLGLGYVPLIPGTAGAIAGVVPAVVMGRQRWGKRLITTVVLVVLAVPVCEYGSQIYGGDDDPRIVADELLTMPVATVALPVSRHPALLAGVFFTSRVLDNLKPPPARAAQRLHGGIGIVLDDVAANIWTLALGLIWWRYFGKPDRGRQKQ